MSLRERFAQACEEDAMPKISITMPNAFWVGLIAAWYVATVL